MFQRLLSNQLTQLLVAAAAMFGVLVCMFPRWVPSLSWVVNYAVQLMLLYLAGGLFFLFVKQPKLTFTCFGGCLLLCFFLKYSIKNNWIDRWRHAVQEQYGTKEEPLKLTAAHFNLSNASSPAELSEAVLASKADLLSLHEVTPGWTDWLRDSVALAYPYHHIMVDLGIFGMGLFSKHPFTTTDTFYYNEVPNLRACIKKDGTEICLVSVHTEPALNEASMRRLMEHLNVVTKEVGRMDAPLLVLGEFNSVSWSQELQHFMGDAGLLESRSGFMDVQKSFRNVPIDHIFHSPVLKCADFDALNNGRGRHLGIRAKFRLKPSAYHVKKMAQ